LTSLHAGQPFSELKIEFRANLRKEVFLLILTMNKTIFINQLKKLIAFETVTGNFDENLKALDYIQTLLDPKAIVKRIRNKNTEIFIASNTKSNFPEIAYMVHMDVVSASKSQFNMVQKGDRLIGRGTSDMKFSIPMGVEILNNLIQKKSKLSFALVITTDEEIGGFDGGAYVANDLKFRPKCLIVPDGGDSLVFVEKAKGVCQILIESKGIPAHASKPWVGKNALNPLAKLSTKLLNIYGTGSSRETWNTTMNIGQIQGGISTNQVCAEAVMKLDFRYPETDSIENILGTVTKLANKIEPSLKISLMSTGLPTFTDRGNRYVQSFLYSMEKIYNKKILIDKTYGASDARHFAKYKIPVLMMKPFGGEIHSKDEWISIESCMKFYIGLEKFITDLENISA
jgi:succinyl-diaminopimelate desuccinylase